MNFLLEPLRSLSPTVAMVEWVAIAALALVGIAFFFGLRKAPRNVGSTNILDRVSNNNRVRIAPIKRLYEDLCAIVEKNGSNATVKVIGEQTVREAEEIIGQCVKMLAHRERIVKSGALDPELARASDELKAQAGEAQSDEERRSLESAAAAYEITSAQAGKAKEALERIDAGMKEAEAALELMKSRLNAAALGTDGPSDYESDFRESIMRLRSLDGSLTEVMEMENDLKL